MEKNELSPFQSSLTESYDQMFRSMDWFKDSGFANLGIFLPDTTTHVAACENMMERLLGLVRRKEGMVLDVGCGLGGTTQYITRFYPPDQVHGVNISDYQLQICRRRVPDSHFHLMAAERLEFPESSFDTVISVEAAPHFKGRREFLHEAFRVLKAGGELVLADMLFHSEPRKFRKVLSGQELYRNIDEYRDLLEGCGFRDVTCEDVTRPCFKGFVDHTRSRTLNDLVSGRIDGDAFRHMLHFADKLAALPVTAYVLAHASKPI